MQESLPIGFSDALQARASSTPGLRTVSTGTRLSSFTPYRRLLSIVAVALVAATAAPAQTSSTPPDSKTSVTGSAATNGLPAGSQRCMFCHPGEVEGYARTTMAHSLRRAAQEPAGTVTAHGSTITMRSTSDGYIQGWQNAGESRDYRVDYVIGSGTHASGYLVNLGNHLFQSPVAFYSSRQAYDLAPGYENTPDPDFTRPVTEECVLCHSGTALHVSGTLSAYRSPIFSAESITCERCHGPVEKHLSDPRAGNIINPARLEGPERDSICEQCHLFGVARVANPGKKLADFVPGQRLEDTFTIYRNAVPPGSTAGSFKVISHVEQLALSACARNSNGRLWCGTCHDPHNKPLPSESSAYYRMRCLSCHTAAFPASHPAKDSDCLACHMPRRNARDGGHTVFTDHRIQRRQAPEGDLAPDTGIAAWREPAPDLQRRNLGIAYIDVGMQRHSSSFIIQGYRALTEVQHQFSNDSELFKWIGDALLVGRQTADAKYAFERALQLDPSPLAEAGAASPYIQLGDTGSAIAHLERAVSLDPLDLPAASSLSDLYRKQGKTEEAAALVTRVDAAMRESQPPGPDISASFSAKRADEAFKNIQVLKGIPADQLLAAMEFISSSLGVECAYCHVTAQFEKDDKKTKQTARKMMRMTLALNKESFANRREITCYSCHRGAADPVSTPSVDSEDRPNSGSVSNDAVRSVSALPTVSQILERYVNALGGAAAIEGIRTRREKGTATAQGYSASVEIFMKAPEKRAMVRHLAQGDSSLVFDGHAGWFTLPGRPPQELQGSDLEAVRLDADLQFPLRIRQVYPDLRVEYPETISGRAVNALYAIRESRPAAKFYFDETTSLLARVVRFADSPFGANPTQIDYADYRDVDGVKVPFRVTLSQPQSVETIQLDEVEQNGSIDDAKFVASPGHK